MGRRTSWVVAALVSLGLTVLPGGLARAQIGSTEWAQLGYVGYDSAGYFVYVPTNAELWKAQRIVNTASGMSPQPATPEIYQGKVLEVIWKKSCPATKAQKVTLSRKVNLPGPASSWHVGLSTLVWNTSMHQGKNPFAWAELRLNGSTLLRLDAKRTPLGTWVGEDLSAGAVDAQPGLNTLSVVAQKKKTKKSWAFCDRGIPDFGVAAEMYAVPRSEATSSIPYGSFSGQMTATVSNAGPSHLVGGQFSFRSTRTGAAQVSDALGQVSGQVDSCTTYVQYDGVVVTCPMPVMAPGTSLTVDLYLQLVNATCPGTWTIPFTYRVTGLWREDNTSDNGQEGRYLACPA